MGTEPGGGGLSVWEEREMVEFPATRDKHSLSGGLLGSGSLPNTGNGSVSTSWDLPHPVKTHF